MPFGLVPLPHLEQIVELTKVDLKRDLITATAAISGLASFLFGFMTNLPVALA
jgi:xanthine/uracil/vitamin C permease (AzgA family)